MSRSLIMAVAVATASLGATIETAEARIRCKEGNQIIPGVGLHATPYCEIKYLADVARGSYGISTTFARLRNSDGERERVCQVIGHDSRIYSTCLPYRNDGDSRRFR